MDTTTSYLGFRLAHPFIAAPALTGGETADIMKALVYLGPGRRAWQSKPRPVIRDPADAVVRITTSTIGDPDAAEARPVGKAAAGEAGHPPVRARRHYERLPHVRERREGTRAEGDTHERQAEIGTDLEAP